VACWSTKAAISMKSVKIEEKLLWRAYRNSPFTNALSNGTTAGLPFSKIGGLQPPPKTPIVIISGPGTGIATYFKHGHYIHRVHSDNIPLEIFRRKGSVGVFRDFQIFLGTLYYLRNG